MIYTDYSSRVAANCFTPGRGGQRVRVLIAHNTGGPADRNYAGQPYQEARRISDNAANYLTSNTRQASVHWVVGAEAAGAPLYRVVPEANTAYHCGGNPPQFPSRWVEPGTGQAFSGFNLNQVSIGIELVGLENETPGPNQLGQLKTLVQEIVGRYPILKETGRIAAHATLEGDRRDGLNWVNQAQSWAREVNNVTPPPPPPPPNDPNRWVPPETGFEVNNAYGFLNYWRTSGGLPEFGFPLSGARRQNGNPNIVEQYFERVRLEYHLDDKRIYRGRIGAELLALLEQRGPV